MKSDKKPLKNNVYMAKNPDQNLSISKEEFLKQCLEPNPNGGKPNKYKEEYIETLYKVFNNFGGLHEFVGIVGINDSTFYDWMKAHPKFKKAYETVKKLSYAQWEKLPLTEKDLNVVYWTAIMRNRFNFGKPRIKKANGKKPLEVVDNALESVEKGDMSIKDAKSITEIAEKRIEMEAKVKVEAQQENLADRLTSEQRLKLKEWLSTSGE